MKKTPDHHSALEGNKPETAEEKRKKLLKTLRDYAITIAIAVVLALLFINFIAYRSVVEGDSMRSTLSDGDNLIVEKVSYYFHDPERFDVVIIHVDDRDVYVKRIIGLPGETVQILDGRVYINGELLESDVYGALIRNAGRAAEPVTLGEDEFFVLGDNRNNSQDSRYERPGSIKRSQIMGRCMFRIYPFDKLGALGD